MNFLHHGKNFTCFMVKNLHVGKIFYQGKKGKNFYYQGKNFYQGKIILPR